MSPLRSWILGLTLVVTALAIGHTAATDARAETPKPAPVPPLCEAEVEEDPQVKALREFLARMEAIRARREAYDAHLRKLSRD